MCLCFRFDQLSEDERKLTLELNFLTTKVQSWDSLPEDSSDHHGGAESNSLAHILAKGAKPVRLSSAGGLPNQIAEFNDFLTKHGGHSGGWDDLSHSAFVKIWHKNKGEHDKVVGTCIVQIPGVSVQDIERHTRWFEKYLQLLEAKKHAISQWKVQKSELNKGAEQDLGSRLEEDARVSMAVHRRAARDSARVKASLEMWRAKKQQLELEKRQMEETEKKDANAQHTKWKQRHIATKKKVAAYIENKEAEEQLKRLITSASEIVSRQSRMETEREELAKLSQRDMRIAEKRKQKIEAKRLPQKEKEKRIESLLAQVVVHAKPDPSRIMQLTEGLKHRLSSSPEQDREAADKVRRQFEPPNLRQVRFTPQWRRGIS
ncbi:uncharacterized protein BJ171DRAFT_280401 [Polychytrium aggregatum]|uniref:uncharacterized protein n=1 Tax=Polychytrium aggregatum TaxID=110093 RepID=UPI0022FE2AD2|nr:uncharacterized protein BJ171DRAFT_280401 [Polychytrium aggregatum]KAI9207717.1 hypothetical protein BJ171DRAFT_280401 [Polychytrium aggregatum]